MKCRKYIMALYFIIIMSIFFIATNNIAIAAPIDTDYYPPDVTYFSPPPPTPPAITYKFIDSRKWEENEKKIIREAIREWDIWICNEVSFVETTGDDWDVSLRWAGSGLFNGNYSTNLGVWSGKPGEYSIPWDTTKYPLKEIYFNSQYFDPGFDKINNAVWYIDDDPTTDEQFNGYDLLTVAKHEFGHYLGIRGDWGQDEPFTDTNGNGKYDAGEPYVDVNGDGKWGIRSLSWTSSDEVMWGKELPDVRKHLRPSDLRALREVGTHHVVPEPSTLLLLSFGLLGLVKIKKKFS